MIFRAPAILDFGFFTEWGRAIGGLWVEKFHGLTDMSRDRSWPPCWKWAGGRADRGAERQ